jgi:hypothetical protein
VTKQITRDLIDMQEHPRIAIASAVLTLLIILACLIGCGALLAAVSKIGILL